MRILIVTSHRNVVGGVEKYLQSVIPGLHARGHAVGLLHEFPFHEDKEGIDSGVRNLPSWSAELGVAASLDAVSGWKPDVVYCHGIDQSGLEQALLERYPGILYAHTYIGTCVSSRKCHAAPRLEPCGRKLGAGCLLLYFPRRCGGLNPITMWRLYERETQRATLFPRYRSILVASRHMREEFERHSGGGQNVELVPLPSSDILAAAVPPPERASQSRILFLGRLVDVKGADYLLRAMPEAARKLGRTLTLTLAGEGADRKKLEELAQHLNVRAEFPGWLNTAQKRDLLEQSDLLAVPSLWPEPFGLVGIEAGAVGVPAVGYAVGGIPDWLIAGKSGEIAPGHPPTVQGLTEAIVRALENPLHHAALRRGAWEVARQFTLQNHLDQLEPILAAA